MGALFCDVKLQAPNILQRVEDLSSLYMSIALYIQQLAHNFAAIDLFLYPLVRIVLFVLGFYFYRAENN